MNNKYILESLASDLKRVALSLYRGSNNMAQRFMTEALKRKQEVNRQQTAPYINKILEKINVDINYDDALMYSTIIQNYTQHTF